MHYEAGGYSFIRLQFDTLNIADRKNVYAISHRGTSLNPATGGKEMSGLSAFRYNSLASSRQSCCQSPNQAVVAL